MKTNVYGAFITMEDGKVYTAYKVDGLWYPSFNAELHVDKATFFKNSARHIRPLHSHTVNRLNLEEGPLIRFELEM